MSKLFTTEEIRQSLHELRAEERKNLRIFKRGVYTLAGMIIDNIDVNSFNMYDHLDYSEGTNGPDRIEKIRYNNQVIKKSLLCGADNWLQYSNGACALYVTEDIEELLIAPSRRRASSIYNGRDVIELQAFALEKAQHMIQGIIHELIRKAGASSAC